MANYPSTPIAFDTHTDDPSGGADPAYMVEPYLWKAEHANAIEDEVKAIAAQVGYTSAAAGTVRARLADLEAAGGGVASEPRVRYLESYGLIGDGAAHTITAEYGSLAAGVAANPTWSTVTSLAGSDYVDYAAWQAALNDWANWDQLKASGKAAINKTLIEPSNGSQFFGKRISGLNREDTVIKQMTNNIAVVKTLSSECHSVTWEHIHLTYNTPQTASDTAANCFELFSDVGVSFGSHYWRTWSNMRLSNGYNGIAATGTTYTGPWGCLFHNLLFSDILNTALKVYSPVAVGGLPTNTYINIQIHNQQTRNAIGPALELHTGEHYFIGLDIERWVNTAVYAFGGALIHIIGLHVEWHEFTGATAQLFHITDLGSCVVETASVSVDSCNVSDHIALINAGNNANFTVRDWLINFSQAVTAGYTSLVRPNGHGGRIKLGKVEFFGGLSAEPAFDYPVAMVGWGYEPYFYRIEFEGYSPGEVPATFFGVVADDSTDNVTALTRFGEWLSVTSTTRSPSTGIFPVGTARTSGTVTFSNLAAGVTIKGMGEWKSKLLSTVTAAPGAPVLKFYTDTTNVDGVHFYDIQIGYVTMQPIANHQSYGVMIDAPEDEVAQRTVSGWDINNLKLHRCHIGMGIRQKNTNGSTRDITVGWWQNHIGRIDIGPTSQSGLVISSPNPIGMPEWTMDNIYIANTYEAYWSTTGPGGPAIVMGGVSGTIGNLAVEGWYNRVIDITGGGSIKIGSFYTEWHRFTGVAAQSSGSSYPTAIFVDGAAATPGVVDIGIIQFNLGGASGTSSHDVSQEQGSGGSVIDFSTILNVGQYATLVNDYFSVKFVSTRAQGNCVAIDGVTSGGAIVNQRFVDAAAGVANKLVVVSLSSFGDSGRIRTWDARHALLTKAGAIADSDFQIPRDGLMGLDETNHRLYVRDGGTWRYATLT